MFALVFLPVLIWLGLWQLDRADQKNEMRARWDNLNPVTWPVKGDPVKGQPVVLQGRYVPDRQWLLDNRTRGGRAGYEILTLFKPESGAPVVINRGWIAGTRDRSRLPEIEIDSRPHRLEARVASWPAPPIVGDVHHPETWPKRVQFLTWDLATDTTDAPIDSAFLRLADQQQPGALQADWKPSRMGASTHYGYAVQWFGLAIALVALTIVASFRDNANLRSTRNESTDDIND